MEIDKDNSSKDDKEPYIEWELLHEEFERNRPDIQDECLKWARYLRMKAKAVQLRYNREHSVEKKPKSIINRIIQFLGFDN